METESPLKFQVSKSRFSTSDPALWAIRRERLLAVTALIGLAGASLATFKGELFLRLTRLNPDAFSSIPRRALLVGALLLGFRSLARAAVHTILQKAIYPRCGTSSVPHPSWNEAVQDGKARKIEPKDASGHTIHGHIALSAAHRERRQAAIFCSGNNHVYDERAVYEACNLAAETGHDIVEFNARGYGSTMGVRSPNADFLALEAVIEQLLKDGYAPEDISLVGTSIGSGMVSRLSSIYQVRQTLLLCPFGSIDSLVSRLACEQLGWLGWLLLPLIRGVVRDHFGYDNVAAIHEAAKQSASSTPLLKIRDSRGDDLMGGHCSPSEAERIEEAWNSGISALLKPQAQRSHTTDIGIGHGLISSDRAWINQALLLDDRNNGLATTNTPRALSAGESQVRDLHLAASRRDQWLSRISALVLAGSLFATWRPAQFLRLTSVNPNALSTLPRRLCLLGSTLLAARQLGRKIAHSLILNLVYSGFGRGSFPKLSWSEEPRITPFHVTGPNGKEIIGHFVKPSTPSAVQLNKVALLPWSGPGYDQSSTQDFLRWADESGQTLALFHLPSHGATGGPASPHQDALAIEAVVQGLQGDGYALEEMTLVDLTWANGAVAEVATNYELSQLVLVAPFGNISLLEERCAQRLGIWRKILSPLIPGVLRDYFSHDYSKLLPQGKTSDLCLIDHRDSKARETVDELEAAWNSTGKTPAKRVTVSDPSLRSSRMMGARGAEWIFRWLGGSTEDFERNKAYTFTSNETRFTDDSSSRVQRREVLLGIASGLALSIGLIATYKGKTFSALTSLNPKRYWSIPRWSLLLGGGAGCLRLIGRQVAERLIHSALAPTKANDYNPSWTAGEGTESKPLEFTDMSGRKIQGHLVFGSDKYMPEEREVIVLTPSFSYMSLELEVYTKYAKGINRDVVLIAMPGYGLTAGPSLPEANCQALETVLKGLVAYGYRLDHIELRQENSADAQAICHVAAHYPVGELTLINPESDVAARLPESWHTSRLARWTRPLWIGVLRELYDRNSLAAISEAARTSTGSNSLYVRGKPGAADDFVSAWNLGCNTSGKPTVTRVEPKD